MALGLVTRFVARSHAADPSDEPPTERLPERVKAAIRAQEEYSEILIGWVQLGIVCVFSALYMIAPRAADSAANMFEPVPMFLGGYFVFTGTRLLLAYRRFTPAWFLDISVIIDMALLMALIWSFHIQYGQPAAFYLKAPTLLYVFIFIALRALRFDPRFVLTAGVVAAAGWLALVAYAVYFGGEDMITRDFVGYMTGNRILLGAEFDKVISILVVTLILTVALSRARRLLVIAVREGAAADDLKRFFAPEIARTITLAEQAVAAGQGEARDAATLMVDIRGFTRFAASIPPDDVIRLLAGYQAHIVPAIRRHGGSIDKFLGDGIMATFGAARPSASYAADALRALDDVMAAADAWNAFRRAEGFTTPLRVNAAVASGRVVFGAVGDADRLEYTVIGDAVNLAAKLEKHNKVEAVRALVTARTYRLAVDQGYQPPAPREVRPQRRVPDVEEPIDLVVAA